MSEKEKTGSAHIAVCITPPANAQRLASSTHTIYHRRCGPAALLLTAVRANASATSKWGDSAAPMLILPLLPLLLLLLPGREWYVIWTHPPCSRSICNMDKELEYLQTSKCEGQGNGHAVPVLVMVPWNVRGRIWNRTHRNLSCQIVAGQKARRHGSIR